MGGLAWVCAFSLVWLRSFSPAYSYSPYPLNPLLRGTAESSRAFRVSYVNFLLSKSKPLA